MSELTDKERRGVLAKVIDKLDLAYNKDIGADPEKIRLWYHQIGHLNEAAALATADACISTHKWLPTISEYLEISRQVRRQQEADKEKPLREVAPHVQVLQDKGLKVQLDLIRGHAESGLKHNHSTGWENCPVCSQAVAELDEDDCRTCFLLDTHGLVCQHFVPTALEG